jgi:hypothetical protein
MICAMPYYCFNRSPEVSEIERIAQELDLTPQKGISLRRSWSGYLKKCDGALSVHYQPYHKLAPLLLETQPDKDHTVPEILEIIQKFASVSRPTEIYDHRMDLYDMSEFYR